jgi:hypothetical protein
VQKPVQLREEGRRTAGKQTTNCEYLMPASPPVSGYYQLDQSCPEVPP